MPKTVDQIRQQIAKLQEQEKALLQKEVSGVVARIKEAVAHYGLTADQIFGGSAPVAAVKAKAAGQKKSAGRRGRRAEAANAGAMGAEAAGSAETLKSKASSPAKGTKIAAKYKDEGGNTWTGRGSQPRWLRAALESGKKLDDFLIS